MGYESECKEEVLLEADSIHGVVVKDITLREVTSQKTGKTSRFLNFKFQIVRPGHGYGDEILGKTLYGEIFAEMTTRPGNKYREWAQAILGRDIPAGMKLDTDDLLELPCDVSIMHEPDWKDPSRIWERVGMVLPSSDPNAGTTANDPWSSSYGKQTDPPPF